jgi:sucrose phosphorylase
MANSINQRVKEHLQFIYKAGLTENTIKKFNNLIDEYRTNEKKGEKWNEKDAVLITYGDSVKSDGEVPLNTLKSFLDENLESAISCVHILPFFPYSSDDGFSVIDYLQVDPNLGTWDDVEKLCEKFDLMADLVINHISQHSEWFKQYKEGREPGKNYFLAVDPKTDLSQVVRPRSLPLLTKVETANGTKHVWTTFSDDQIDLNFENPDLLHEMVRIVLEYARYGARIIRLDAIAFLWKQIGTNCLHLPETHRVVKLIRDVMEECFPKSIILTETNVPHKENLSYFGNGDEAHMVYQFSLPPLLLHALHTGNSEYLTKWAGSIEYPGTDCTFFNFTASHDGVGVRPLEGILPQDEFDLLTTNMKSFGGHISTKKNSDGSDSPYEMNITYFDAMKGTKDGEDAYQTDRFICSQTIAMSLMGVPAIYIHSFTATPNYHEGVKETGRARTINRMKWDKATLEKLLHDEQSNSHKVFNTIKKRLEIRSKQKVFHPSNPQEVIDLGKETFVVKRWSKSDTIYAVANVSAKKISVDKKKLGVDNKIHDILSGNTIFDFIELEPYQVCWLTV